MLALVVAVVALVVLAVLLYALPGECKCVRCEYHVVQRVADKERRERQAHDNQHRWYGSCYDVDCPRNKGARQ